MRCARRLASLAAVLGLALTSCRGCQTVTESHVDVPLTLDAAKALARPPEVTVSVERKTATGGGGACGHSPLCLVFVPVMIYGALFPEKWDEVTVTRGGAPELSARYETDGELIEATVRKDGVARLVGVLKLSELRRRVVVELGRAPLGAGGREDSAAFVKTPILPQVDLAAAYRAALAEEDADDADDRAALYVEHASWLKEEAMPLLLDGVPRELDETAAETLKRLCSDTSFPGCAELLTTLGQKDPGPLTSAAGFRAAEAGFEAQSRPYAHALARHACSGEEGRIAIAAAESLAEAKAGPQATLGLLSDAPPCQHTSRRVLLAAMLRQRPSDAELEEALRDRAVDAAIVGRLDAHDPAVRRIIVAAMPGREEDTAYVLALERAPDVPTAQELELLAKSYLKDLALADAERRMAVLGLFWRARAQPAAAAKRVITEAIARAAEDDRPLLRAALVAMGDRQQALPASRGLAGITYFPTGGFSDETVMARALVLAGCEEDEVVAAGKAAYKVRDSDLGPLCTRGP